MPALQRPRPQILLTTVTVLNRHTLSRRILTVSAVIFLAASPFVSDVEAAGLTFTGGSRKVLSFEVEKNTGLEKVYVAFGTEGLSASFTSTTGERPVWKRFSNLGGGYAEDIQGIVYNGNTSTLTAVEPDMGYIVQVGDRQTCFWVVDYSDKQFSINSVTPSAQQECDASMLDVVGSGEPIHYFSVTGQQRVLSREITVDYSTLEWNEEQKIFTQTTGQEVFESLHSPLTVRPASLCQTTFLITGDRFLKAWGEEVSSESDMVDPHAVEAHTEAVQEIKETENSNQMKSDNPDALGGSAPASISFMAYVTDAVIHHEWQIAEDENFENIEYRFTEQDLDYTFTDDGTLFVRYVGSNADGSCDVYGDVYTVSIGASDIKCPNAFSPNDDGVNDEWKVSYRSLLDFKCWIFDRYGAQLFYTDNPETGWDGKRGGKVVPPGVYYYVIQATGADDKKYKLSGDINIIRFKGKQSSGSGSETPVQ